MAGEESMVVFFLFCLGAFFLLIYFVPSIVVLCNKHHTNKAGVIIINVLLGWSFIGWVISLVWACQKTIPQQVNVAVANHIQQPSPAIPVQPHYQHHYQSPPQSLPGPVEWQAHLYRNGELLQKFTVPFRPMVLGRGSDAEVRIDDSQVSGRHWQVMATPNGVELKDLCSSNGTWKHGQVRVDSDLAAEGDWYQVGAVQIAFSRGDR